MKKLLVTLLVIIGLGAGYYFLWENPIYANPPREGCELIDEMFTMAQALSISPRSEIVKHKGRTYICPKIISTVKELYTAAQGKFEVAFTNEWQGTGPYGYISETEGPYSYDFYNAITSTMYDYSFRITAGEGNFNNRIQNDAQVKNVSIGNNVPAKQFIDCNDGTTISACTNRLNYVIQNKDQGYWIVFEILSHSSDKPDIDYNNLAPEHMKVRDDFLNTFKPL